MTDAAQLVEDLFGICTVFFIEFNITFQSDKTLCSSGLPLVQNIVISMYRNPATSDIPLKNLPKAAPPLASNDDPKSDKNNTPDHEEDAFPKPPAPVSLHERLYAISEMNNLKEKGALTEEEFQKLKNSVLKNIE